MLVVSDLKNKEKTVRQLKEKEDARERRGEEEQQPLDNSKDKLADGKEQSAWQVSSHL